MPKLPLARAKRIAHGVRLGRKVTGAEVAHGIGITPGHLSQIETQKASASDEVTALLADYYDCTPADLEGAGGKPDHPPKQPKRPPGPRRREESDTKGPNRVSGAA